VDELLEGWYTDPFARYEARWMSAGRPTELVRDGRTEAHDPPPDEPFKVMPVRVGVDAPRGADDLRRADDAVRESGFDQEKANRRAWDSFDQSDP